ncbi:flagellin [Pelagicoccus enzymogenes]|nr:flagellin [Pelagicoccus enzymogenes]
MSISLSTNQSATLARDNLASVSSHLQKSLSRLSSGSRILSPSDDAGGLAVSMKMSAAIKRQAAASANISNAMSYLQTQDGALDSANQILSRIGELKNMVQDVTKNETDKANYNTEFRYLQDQLADLSTQQFNGVSLFSSAGLSVKTGVDGTDASVAIGGVDLLESSTLFQDKFSGNSLSGDWTVDSGSVSVSDGVLTIDTGQITLNEAFDEPVHVEVGMRLDHPSDLVDVYNDSNYYFSDYIDGTEVPDGGWHTLSFDLNADGTMSSLQLDGNDFSAATGTVSTTPGSISLSLWEGGGANGAEFRNLKVSSQSGSSVSDTASVQEASGLQALDIDTLKSAIEDLAGFRAQNGAQQSRLQFAKEQLEVSRINLSEANSRVVDVDLAVESTALARFNILQQASASMLSQANQSQQVALRLIG